MRIRLVVGCILLCSVSHPLLCQIANVSGYGNSIIRETKYLDIEGSPYLYNSWRTGSVTDRADKVYLNQLIKYDSHTDEIIVSQEGQGIVLSSSLYPKFEFKFSEEGSSEVTKRVFQSGFTIPGFSQNSYFEILTESKYKLLKKTKTDLMDQSVSNYGSSTAVKRFVSTEDYFLINESGKAFELRLSKRSLLDALGDDKVDAEKYIKEQNLKLKSEADFVHVLRHLK